MILPACPGNVDNWFRWRLLPREEHGPKGNQERNCKSERDPFPPACGFLFTLYFYFCSFNRYRLPVLNTLSNSSAAGLFATHTRDAKEVANLLGTSEQSVHQWAKEDLWEEVMQTLNYDGEHNFRVKPRCSKDKQGVSSA